MYTRASASDYDDFQAKGWTTKELIPLMRKHETYQRACNNRDIHGFEGPIKGMSAMSRFYHILSRFYRVFITFLYVFIMFVYVFIMFLSFNEHELTVSSIIWQLHVPRDAGLPSCRRVSRHPCHR
jgi:hypothetical protein